MWINKDIEKLDGSAIRKMAAVRSKREDVINLGIGEPEYTTPQNIIDAGKKALDQGFTKYTLNTGLPALRETIAAKLKTDNGLEVKPEEIAVTVGGEEAIATLLIAALNPGDEVLVMDPCFPGHLGTVAVARGVAVRVPLKESNGWHLDVSDVKKAITPKTRVILYNTPGNPCGSSATRDEMEALAQVAIEHDLLVITDEVYEKIVYDGRKHVSLASLPGMAQRTAGVFAFSKTYAMTGWRIGYFVAQNKQFREQALKVHQNLVSCANAAAQQACIEALRGPQDWVAHTLEKYQQARDLVFRGVNAIEGISCVKPEGAFYAMINVSALGDDVDVAMHLLENQGVRLIPGSGFGEGGRGYLRLCYACRPETIVKGLERIAEGAAELLAMKKK